MKEFYTADNHSKAKKMPLITIDGKISDHYLMVLGKDSKPAREALSRARRNALSGSTDQHDFFYTCVAGYIESWDLPKKKECTEENKMEFLSKAPYIADLTDMFASTNDNFTKK